MAQLPPRAPHAGTRWLYSASVWLVLLPLLIPATGVRADPSGSMTLAAGGQAARHLGGDDGQYQAWLRGRQAAGDAGRARATVQRAAHGPGATAAAGLPLPSGTDATIPAPVLAAYRDAASWAAGFAPSCHLPWTVLAGIGRVESNHGRDGGLRISAEGDISPAILGPVLDGTGGAAAIRDTDHGRYDHDTTWDRAVGPMQFIPSTWMSAGRDGNGDGVADPSNVFDATVSAAAYLCLAGGGSLADPANLRRAVFSYNHSQAYVDAVLGWAGFYAHRFVPTAVPTTGALAGTSSSSSSSSSSSLASSSSSTAATTGPAPTTARPTSTTRAPTTTGQTTTSRSTTTNAPTSTTTAPTTTAGTTTSGATTTTRACSTTTTTGSTTTTSSTTTTMVAGSTTTTTTLPPC